MEASASVLFRRAFPIGVHLLMLINVGQIGKILSSCVAAYRVHQKIELNGSADMPSRTIPGNPEPAA